MIHNNKAVKVAVDTLVAHVEQFHQIMSGKQHEFEALVAGLIVVSNAPDPEIGRVAWNQGAAAAYTHSIAVDSYYRNGNYGSHPPEPVNPYKINT